MTDGSSAGIKEMYSTWLLFGQTRHLAYRVRDKELRPYGIGPRQGALLYLIHALGRKATPSEIAQNVCVEDHTVCANVNVMVKHGLVRRVSDLRKKNMVRVELTDKGKEAYEQSMQLSSVKEIMSCMSKEEMEQFNLLLEKILKKSIEILGEHKKTPRT